MIVLVLLCVLAGAIGFAAARRSADALFFYLIGLVVAYLAVAMTAGGSL